MKNLHFKLAIALVTIWAVLFFGYNTGTGIHILLILALLSIFIKMARD